MHIRRYIIVKYFSRYSMKYPTTSLILGSGPTFAVLTMSSILQIKVSLGIPHELFIYYQLITCSRQRRMYYLRPCSRSEKHFLICEMIVYKIIHVESPD